MLGITDLSTYLIGVVLIVLLPGPNSLYVLSVAARRSTRAGFAAAGGVLTGDAVLMTLSAAGVASLLQANDAAFAVVKWVGAGYLGFLAYAMLRGALEMWRSRRGVVETVEQVTAELPATADASAQPSARAERPYRRALLISLLNPKAILFFVAFFVQFVDPAYAHPAVSFLVLGAFAQACSLLYLSVLIFAGTRLAAAFRRRKAVSAVATSAVGAVFLGFAVKLSLSSA
ncbi:leucine efflux protein LeuE [Nocardioides sp. zg-536]|uniref:Leucine efflux protein LeuE n=1 Tax=Nocardioides faecalis TaxID=2803858 RepID=A0A938Y176_9ACTN|nr:leucine efflux protein LeuE [Nocardioides faecalis]MBM9460021.1 leucine efflux protein LeuE [Nocardioides faecalis]MBS4753111.1 leucine efflux protein LeuE [Nocardioides faecalis]QVI58758.1 leucine efflux protein LeuE [Nocardioides faecalis]